MKTSKRRGFTTVELVIVIAVIAVLAAVLIPTFTNLITKAGASAALQACKNTLTEFLTENDGQLPEGDVYFAYNEDPEVNETHWFHLEDGKFVSAAAQEVDSNDKVWADDYHTVMSNGRRAKATDIIGVVTNCTEEPYMDPAVEILCKID